MARPRSGSGSQDGERSDHPEGVLPAQDWVQYTGQVAAQCRAEPDGAQQLTATDHDVRDI